MFSYDKRIKAVKLFIQYDLSAAAVMHELGYPKNRHTLYAWYKEYKETGQLHRRRTQRKKYSEDQKRTAVDYYLTHGRNVSRTVKKLGYPSRTTLTSWLEERVPGFTDRKGLWKNLADNSR
jgi:putative transposase